MIPAGLPSLTVREPVGAEKLENGRGSTKPPPPKNREPPDSVVTSEPLTVLTEWAPVWGAKTPVPASTWARFEPACT